jgi:CRP/FNR family transcriptional regulator
MKTLLIQHFREMVPLSDEDITLILPHLEVRTYKRKEMILQEGQVSKHMRFVAKGAVHAFSIDEKGNEHTVQLAIENWWINDLYSYLTETASLKNLQAVEESVLIVIPKSSLEVLYKQIPSLSEFWRLKFQNAYVSLQERVNESNRTDAMSKYERLIRDYPGIDQRFPQYMLASYLGITVEYLSYLRKKRSIS